MAEFEDSIAHEAHKLVHGARAKDYGHPRFDFSAIAKVWTGLLSDKLLPGAELDPYRVAVLMTGLKLCRLVKSPDHHDSRVDTIGYMLTMERLDEPAIKVEEEPLPLSVAVNWDKVKKITYPDPKIPQELLDDLGIAAEEEPVDAKANSRAAFNYIKSVYGSKPLSPYSVVDIQAMEKFAEEELVRADAAAVEDDDIDDGDYDVHGRPAEYSKYSQFRIWFDAGESKVINGKVQVNSANHGRYVIFPFLPGAEVTIENTLKPTVDDLEKAQESYDQKLPWQPPGQVQGDWVKDPAGRFWVKEAEDEWHRLSPAGMVPTGWQEVKCPAHGKERCEACSQPGDLSKCCCGYWDEYKIHWDTCPARNRSFPEHLPRNAQTRIHEVHGGDKDCWCGHRAKDSMPNSKGLIQWDQHSHRGPEPCMPGCPVFDAARDKNKQQINNIFEFTGEQVEMQRPDD